MGDEGEDVPDYIVLTQQTLGALQLKRPKLTAQLLQKPPFRFLHDVVTNVTEATGFAAGLYTEEYETKSANIKDKDSKIAYLTKIIRCVEYALNTQINIRVGKVVAGLEAENTNAFLTKLGEAAQTVSDSSRAVERVLAESAAAPPPAAPPDGGYDAPPPRANAPPPMPASLAPTEQAPPPPPPPQQPERDATSFTSAPMRKPEDEASAAAGPAEGGEGGKRVRPKSARRPPPRVTSNEVKVEKQAAAQQAAGPVSGVILEGMGGEDDAGTIEMIDTAGESVNTSSMAGGPSDGPQGRLGKNLMDAKNELEAMGAEREKAGGPEVEEAQDAGGIIIRKKGGGGGGGGKLPSKGEVSALRTSIQTLCQSSNPLGRCLEYVLEDDESMNKEFEEHKKLGDARQKELDAAEDETKSILKPLQEELESIEALIKDKQSHIRYVKAKIIANDALIEEKLFKVVNR